MPHIGHALTGLGIGLAASGEPRSRTLQGCWLGLCLTLSCWQDAAEWFGRLFGVRVWHSGPAGLPVSLVVIGAVAWWLRRRLREPLVVIVAAGAAVVSHGLLDMADGGIPLWWPFWRSNVGAELLRLERWEGSARYLTELRLFAPLVAAGFVVGAWRLGVGAWALAAGLAATAATIVLAVVSAEWAAWGSVTALLVCALVWATASRRGWRPAGWWMQLAVASPVVVFGAALVYGRHEMAVAEEYRAAGRYDAAMRHFERARRVAPLGSGVAPDYYIGLCMQLMGRERAARDYFEALLARMPGEELLQYGYAHVLVTATAEDVRDPESGVIIARELARSAREPRIRGYAERLLARVAAPAAAGTRQATAASQPNSASGQDPSP